MLLLVGLGNPGGQYERNRHNVGFMAADAIHDRHGFTPWRSRFQALCAEGRLGPDKALLLKPQTYMNESGRAVGEAMRFYKLEPEQIVVMHDELDLPPGKIRIKTGGGHGGHNGLRSLDAHIGKDYRRLRLGIGHPGDKARVHGHVLGDFAKADSDWLTTLLEAIAREAPLLAEGKDALFANRLHAASSGGKDSAPKRKQDPKSGPESGLEPDTRPATPDSIHAAAPAKNALAEQLARLMGRSGRKED